MKLGNVLKSILVTSFVLSSLSIFAGERGHAYGHNKEHHENLQVLVSGDFFQAVTSSFLFPFIMLTATTDKSLGLKVQASRSDAEDYLENGKVTNNLTATFSEIKKYEEFSQASDLQLATLIVSSGNI